MAEDMDVKLKNKKRNDETDRERMKLKNKVSKFPTEAGYLCMGSVALHKIKSNGPGIAICLDVGRLDEQKLKVRKSQ